MYIIYSKNNCPRCDTAKQLLERKGVEYEVKMVGVDFEVEYLLSQGVRMYPFIEKCVPIHGDWLQERVGSLEDLIKEVYQ